MQGAWILFSLLAIAAALPIEGMFQRGAGILRKSVNLLGRRHQDRPGFEATGS